MSSKKYSRDFKLKVLEYYFEHGGDKKFGLKTKTAHHFCIDHKTVSRMLCNPEIVKKARRILGGKKNGSEGCKPTTKHQGLKIGQPYVDMQKMDLNLSGRSGTQNSLPCSSKSSKKVLNQKPSEVPIIELPEDPDFSILKSSIESSASSVSNVAKLLISGTNEVKRLITNECELIYECKVCRNLFRSVINFLAHKRIYCQDEYINVKGSFHKDTGLNMTSETSTIIVEPEPPPESPPIIEESKESTLKIDQIASRLASKNRAKKSNEDTSHSIHKGSSEYFRRIETVNNCRKSLGSDCSVLLQDIAGVSNAVYQTVNPVGDMSTTRRTSNHQRKRERPVQLDPDGQVVERNNVPESSVPKKVAVVCKEEPPPHEEEVEVSCSTCSSTFPSKKLLDTHIGDVHGIERTVYTCPICNMGFLSIWGCVKHLIRIHKKKKHQRERLKHVICSRAYKKVFTTKELARQNHKNASAELAKETPERKEETPLKKEETPLKKEEKESSSPSPLSSLGSLQREKSNSDNGEVSSSQKEGKELVSRVGVHVDDEPTTYIRNKAPVLPNTCPRCMQAFQTQTAMGAHLQFCSLASLSSNSETPEKKIEIQIRKDYNKDGPIIHTSDVAKKNPLANLEVIVKVNKNEDLIHLKIQERLLEVCQLKRLFCLPCKKKYNTIHVLKRHVSQHIGWTRFSCTLCSFKHYEKYQVTEHCIAAHKYNESKAEFVIIKEDNLDDSMSLPSSKETSNKTDSVFIKSDPDEIKRKSSSVQNGDCTSSECSVSIVSEDSLSIKSEFENQEMESADVAYRELIENIDINAENKEERTGIKKRRNSDKTKIDRPQRTRKTKEQKDFVYESVLRSPAIGLRSDNNEKNNVEEATATRQRSVAQQFTVKDRPTGKRKETSPDGVQQVVAKTDRPAGKRKETSQNQVQQIVVQADRLASKQKEASPDLVQQVVAKTDRPAGKRKETSPDREPKKKSCSRGLNNIPSHFNYCNGRDSPDVTTEPSEKLQSKSSVNCSSPKRETLPDTSNNNEKVLVKESIVDKVSVKDNEGTVSSKKIEMTEVKVFTLSDVCDRSLKVIRKIESPVLKARERTGGTELKICKVKTIDAKTAKSMTLIEVKTKDRHEVGVRDLVVLKPGEGAESKIKDKGETKLKESSDIDKKEKNKITKRSKIEEAMKLTEGEAKKLITETEAKELITERKVKDLKTESETKDRKIENEAKPFVAVKREVKELETEKRKAKNLQTERETIELKTEREAKDLETEREAKDLETEREAKNLETEREAKDLETEREAKDLETEVKAKELKTEDKEQTKNDTNESEKDKSEKVITKDLETKVDHKSL